MTDERGMYERDLTPREVDQRTALNLHLQNERDDQLAEIGEKRRQIRALVSSVKKLELRSAEVRREIRTGKVWESRQTSLALDGAPARHGEGPLLDPIELRHLITCVRPREAWPTVAEVERWHEQVRADVQKWCREEHMRAHPIVGMPLPPGGNMPNVLENIVFDRENARARKAERKAKREGKRQAPPKPRPANGATVRARRGEK